MCIEQHHVTLLGTSTTHQVYILGGVFNILANFQLLHSVDSIPVFVYEYKL